MVHFFFWKKYIFTVSVFGCILWLQIHVIQSLEKKYTPINISLNAWKKWQIALIFHTIWNKHIRVKTFLSWMGNYENFHFHKLYRLTIMLAKYEASSIYIQPGCDFFLPYAPFVQQLTAHNWQKWKSRFLKYPCHAICRVEAVDLPFFKLYLKKIWFLWLFEIWGNFVKIWYFVNYCLIKGRI